ncbi:hypothetical protein EJ05DRAFT_485368 [Pseudovirgaria hyperparasitica]|uniref:Small ribosomal subunit protein mS29 n=1 Tax=Pseudovirgaria hyperparasitica TaxID=470096 RepID=A0A6A6WAY4_9PEZI|nr:uncharacterized protein EJ05DRAFT_485368 [Pseudovirgaria hyperparasitica]KAF2759339.1 hypothetical protein EJ05DRAFT_485368 [Pseudovirgaria hyperparasitica]
MNTAGKGAKKKKQAAAVARAKWQKMQLRGDQRRQVRRSVILTNDNALEVHGIPKLERKAIESLEIEGKMVRLMDSTVDQLRAVEAFKHNQGWKYFRHPSMIMTKAAVKMVNTLKRITDGVEPETVRTVVIGETTCGKSTLLLQAIAAAFLKGWIVLNLPNSIDMVNAGIEYAPVPNTSPVQYQQKTYSALLLTQLATANGPLLSKMQTTMSHPNLTFPYANSTLKRLCDLGAQNNEMAWPIFRAVWAELTKPSPTTPPILYTCDNVNELMKPSAYVDPDLKPIHAHDLLHVAHFMEHLSGAQTLSNGGMVLAAPTASGTSDIPTFSHCLRVIEAQQNGHTTKGWHPYKKADERVIRSLQGVEVLRLNGLDKEEARTILNYYAASGMLRNLVDEKFVAEKWTLAGNGNVGQLEKLTVRTSSAKAPSAYT